jgi:hypothetical protein
VLKISKVKEAFKEIEDIIGSDFISDKDFVKAAYSRNVDPAFPDRWADIIVRPETTEEVSEIVKVANKYKIPIVPRGGGADLVGGAATEGGILMDLTRMNKILEINKDDYYIVVECGITWGALLSELLPMGYTTGNIGPGSGFAATIGGGLSNSTAGSGSTKYGLVPDICLGVEVVLPNPQGTIIRTGSAANRYAKPFCRYGVSPDFTGLFMGDVGTMGIKTKAFLRIFPDRAKHRPKITGPHMSVTLEATDQRILDIHLEKLEKIMSEEAHYFEWSFLFPNQEKPKVWNYNLNTNFHFFQGYISPNPPSISCTTCHKVPISNVAEIVKKSVKFNVEHQQEFSKGNYPGIFASMLYLLPNGNFVVLGGFTAENVDEIRDKAMDIWHKKIRNQVKYGAAHYWLGESISQSIVEAGAYTPEYSQFFKDVKKSIDPNFLLSPRKFHMYSYEDDISKHIIKDEE